MAANGGYRVFNTGDVLTAAQVQYYLQNQTVMYFATTTARDAALTGATLVEGMVSYTPATGVMVYNGSAWVSTGTTSPLTTKGDVWGYSTTNARVPVGSNGQVLTADSTQALGVKWATASSGVTTWTNRLTTGSGNRFNQIAWNGSNIYVAVGPSGVLYSSSDAITWTSRTSGFGANAIYNVAYGNGLFVAVGQNGTITTSTDGITWTARTSNMSTNGINDVTYANSLWVAVGGGGGATNTGGITYSSDGITWTRKSQTPTIGTNYACVVWNGTNWIVGATLLTNDYLYASTPSGAWTAGVSGATGGTISSIYWDGTRHILIDGSNIFNYSTSLTLGTVTQYNTNSTPIPIGPSGIAEGPTKLFNNVIYCASVQLFSITPISNAYPSSSVIAANLPTTLWNTTPTITVGVYSLLVTSAGYIIGDAYGHIYTSF